MSRMRHKGLHGAKGALRTKDVQEGVRGGGLALATRHHARVAPHVLVGRRP